MDSFNDISAIFLVRRSKDDERQIKRCNKKKQKKLFSRLFRTMQVQNKKERFSKLY